MYKIGRFYAYPLLVDETGAVHLHHELAWTLGKDVDAALQHLIIRPDYGELVVLYPGQEREVEEQRKYQEEALERTHRDPEWLKLLAQKPDEI